MPAAFLYFAGERRLNLYFKFPWYCLLALLVGTSYCLGQLPSDCDSVETQGAAFSPTASSEQTSAGPRVRQASENSLSIAENWNVGSSCSRLEQIDSLVSTQNTSRGEGLSLGTRPARVVYFPFYRTSFRCSRRLSMGYLGEWHTVQPLLA